MACHDKFGPGAMFITGVQFLHDNLFKHCMEVTHEVILNSLSLCYMPCSCLLSPYMHGHHAMAIGLLAQAQLCCQLSSIIGKFPVLDYF